MSEEISCPFCDWTGKGESNLKRHTTVKHKKTDGILIVSVPADSFTFNEELGIYESAVVGFPPGYDIVAVMNKLTVRQALQDGVVRTNTCVNMVMRKTK